ncbi:MULTISPECIES: hypothetical protein [Flavobacterium]|uniref:PH domain-containing protein n=1 Tax=Flavobacterium jumunjinense TaxID=998845 RepID=A0ABV5GSV1_9FLAO|nr:MULTISPECIES: hypothetical protein [Flavobacterium]
MKRIHFENKRNWIWIAIGFFSLVLTFTGTFEFFDFENPKLNKRIRAIGFFIQFIYYSRFFWYKNYVQLKKKGALVRINSRFGKTLNFNQIKKTELIEKKIIITKTNGNKITFDLNEIEESDTQKLNEIIMKNTITNQLLLTLRSN